MIKIQYSGDHRNESLTFTSSQVQSYHFMFNSLFSDVNKAVASRLSDPRYHYESFVFSKIRHMVFNA